MIDEALSRSGCRLALFNSSGARDRAVRGCLMWPGREQEFRREFERDLGLATRWRVSHLHAVAGVPPASTSRAERIDVALRNLAAVADTALEAGVTITVEFINQRDRPGFGLASLADVVDLVTTLGHPAVRLQFDQYHVAMSGLDPIEEFVRHQRITSYVQIAEAPGRHEPGEGSSLPAFLDTLRCTNFGGTVSLEYDPRGGTETSLAWLQPWRGSSC